MGTESISGACHTGVRQTRSRARGLLVLLLVSILTLAGIASPAGAADQAGMDTLHIIQLADPPLASYRGGIQNLAPTHPAVLGQRRLDPSSIASQAYRAFLARQQDALVAQAAQALGHPIDVRFRYDTAINGLAMMLTPAEAQAVGALPGVRQVQADFARQLSTDRGPTWIGAPNIWNGSRTGGLPGTRGEGVVIGVIDSGINFDHPSFADPGPIDGYDYPARTTHLGLCAPLNPVLCNDKLIGLYDFTGSGPEDHSGHGSHTASTAGGNVVDARLTAPTITIASRISGVAPHANIVSYKACEATPAGECFISALLAAINQATLDGVDVINYSIGGLSSDPWSDLDAQAFLGARNAGIFVSVSAGNSGPGAATIGSPADAPWVMSIAASTHDRKYVNALVNMQGGGTPPANISGMSVSASFGPAPIVYAGGAPYNNPLCLPFAAGTFNGQIVVCDRGQNGRVEKSQNVKAAGGGGFVLVNDQASGNSLVGDAYAVPGVHISYTAGQTLKAWLASGAGHTGSIAGTTRDVRASNGDIIASFSSRGPNPASANMLKPDVTAPGVDILAAYMSTTPAGPDPEYGVISGTSMSSPHVAGAATLLRALHPNWTPAELQSALMTTARTTGVRKENASTPADPFDMGSGRIDLNVAARAGLVLDEDDPDYANSNPANGGLPQTLNLASMSNGACAGVCSWTRTVRSTLKTPVTWRASSLAPKGMTLSISPKSFTLAPGATRSIVITANVGGLPRGAWNFAEVRLTPNTTATPIAHLSVAVRSSGIDTRPVLHFHGNTGAHVSGSTAEADCTGVGAVDISACNGPFLLESAQLSPNPAASWTVAAPLFNGTADRNIYDPNWIWNVTKPTTLAGPLTVDFWAACSGCSDLLLAADWIVRLWADGVKVAEQHVSGTPLLPNVPEKQSVTIEIPMVRATSNFVLHVDPVYLIDNARSVIFYDSSQPCPGANSTEPCDSVVRVPIDKTPPIVTAPVTTIGTGAVANGGLPVRVTWSGTDDATGVARYDLQLATGNTYSTVALAKPTATSHVLTLTPGSTYRFRVRATDGAGNTSAFVAGPNFTVGIVGQTDAAVQYTGRWTSANQIGATNGTVKYARAAGATARYTFTGNSVAWMSTLGADRGLAEIWLDGENAGVVDLYSAQTRASALVFSRSGLASNGTHTLVVKVLNTKNKASSGTRVDVDGFAVVR